MGTSRVTPRCEFNTRMLLLQGSRVCPPAFDFLQHERMSSRQTNCHSEKLCSFCVTNSSAAASTEHETKPTWLLCPGFGTRACSVCHTATFNLRKDTARKSCCLLSLSPPSTFEHKSSDLSWTEHLVERSNSERACANKPRLFTPHMVAFRTSKCGQKFAKRSAPIRIRKGACLIASPSRAIPGELTAERYDRFRS